MNETKNKRIAYLIRLLKTTGYYILLTMIVFVIIWYYMKVELNDLNTANYTETIYNTTIVESDIALKEGNYKFKIFKKSFIANLPIFSLSKNKEIEYVKLLNEKCLDFKALNKEETAILKGYSFAVNLSVNYDDPRNFIFKLLGFFASLLVLIILLIATKKLMNEKYKNTFRYLIILLFLINYSIGNLNSTELNTMNKELFECYQKQLRKTEQ